MKNTNKKEVRSLLISIISVSLFLIIMTTFVYLPKQANLLSSLAFLNSQSSLYVEDLSNGILLRNATPVKDTTGMTFVPYQFRVVNNSNKEIKYNIIFKTNKEKALKQGKELLPNRYLRYSIKEGNKDFIEPTTLTDDGLLYTTTVAAKSNTVFDFKMWLDYNCDNGAMNKIFIAKIVIEEIK